MGHLYHSDRDQNCRSIGSGFTAYCLLLTAYCLLLTAFYLLCVSVPLWLINLRLN
jgi:hypothetical protein